MEHFDPEKQERTPDSVNEQGRVPTTPVPQQWAGIGLECRAAHLDCEPVTPPAQTISAGETVSETYDTADFCVIGSGGREIRSGSFRVKSRLDGSVVYSSPFEISGLSAGAIDTSDWKSHRNEQYGFEVHYPKDFNVTEEFDQFWKFEFTSFKPQDTSIDGSIHVSYNSPNWPSLGAKDVHKFFSDLVRGAHAAPPPVADLGKVKIDIVFGQHKAMKFGSIGEIHNVSFEKGSTKFEIGAKWGHTSDFAPDNSRKHDYDRDREVIMGAFNQILSTLKFTK